MTAGELATKSTKSTKKKARNLAWNKKKLGKIVAEGNGIIHTGPFGSQLHASDYVAEGIPCIMPANMKDNRVDTSEIAFIAERDAQRLSKYIIQAGDIVYSRRGDVTQKALIREKEAGYFCGTGCLLIRPGKEIDSEFLTYFLSTKNIQDWIVSQSIGGTMPNLNTGILKSLPLQYPDKSEQKKIAAVLSALDAKIELNNRINAELEAMAKTLYDYWFVQFDFPFDFTNGQPAPNGQPYKSSGGKMLYNPTLKRNIPEGWSTQKLGNLFTSNRGVSYSSANTGTTGKPMINLASFNVDGSYNPDGLKYYSGGYSQDKVLEPLDLVMCNTQQTAIDFSKDIIGKALLVPDIFGEDIVSSHHITHIRVLNRPLKYYLHRLFNTEHFHKYISGFCSGTNILGLIFSGVENCDSEIPPDTLLEMYAATVESAEKRKSIIINETQQLTELRDWLLPMLMNGQVQVE